MNRISLIIMATLILFTGCLKVKYGSMPDTNAIQTNLTLYASTKADVLEVLGEPRNSGGALLSGHDSSRDMWVYYFEEGSLSDDQRIFLFVVFKEERYDGYNWFSSLPCARPGSP